LSSFSKEFSDQMETNFRKLKEVFSKNGPKNKTLLQFLHRCYRLENANASLEPMFQVLPFFVLVMMFRCGL